MGDLVELFTWYIAFLFSVTLHEAAHAWAAKRGGDLTAYYGGQVSLNPIPHIRREPVGMVVLPLISLFISGWPFGFASAPYDPLWAQRYPKRAAWMALAGPASNLMLVIITGVLIKILIFMGYFEIPHYKSLTSVVAAAEPGFWGNVAIFLSIMFSLNLILASLNMIPLPPLDGSGALALLLSPQANAKYQAFLRQPGLALIGLVIVWNIFWPIFRIIFDIAFKILYPGSVYK